MIITVHRWQPKTNRFNNQKFTLEEADNFFGADFDARQRPDAGFKNFRTQHVDRIEINSYDGTVDIYTSPVSERKYTKKVVGVDNEVALSPLKPLEPKQSLEQMFDDDNTDAALKRESHD